MRKGHGSSTHGYSRMARVNEVVREVVAQQLERLSDPRLGFVTLSSVEVTGDLRHATAYYSVLGTQEEREETKAALIAAAPRIQSALGRQVRLKYLPHLVFTEDVSIESGQRIETILRRLHDASRAESAMGGSKREEGS